MRVALAPVEATIAVTVRLTADIEKKRSLAKNLVRADALQQQPLARENLDGSFHDQKSLVRRVAGTVDDLTSFPDNVLVPFEYGLPDPESRCHSQSHQIRASLICLGHFRQGKQIIPAERELRGASVARITSPSRSVAQPGSALYWG